MVRILIATIALCLVFTTVLAVPVGFAREDALQLRGYELKMHHYRDIDSTHAVSARDDSLEARSFWQYLKKGLSSVIGAVAPVAKIATKLILREDPSGIIARGATDYELHFHHVRDEAIINVRENDLDSRSFWQSLKKGLSTAVGFAGKFLREEDIVEHVTRDPQDMGFIFREEEIARDDGELELRWESDDILGRDDDFEFVRGLELEELD